MNQVRVARFGNPSEVAELVSLGDLPRCTDDQVLVRMLASPINPADLLEIRGQYAGSNPPLTPGAEGAGRVLATGSSVTGVVAGDMVMTLGRGNWSQLRLLRADEVVVMPAGLPLESIATLRVNPATAYLLLEQLVPFIQEDEHLVVNAANSSVGELLARMCKKREVPIIRVVRRPDVAERLEADGRGPVLLDDESLPERVRALTAGGARAALDCVAGHASSRLARSLLPGGRLCVYGHLSGIDCQLPSRLLTFSGIRVSGFNLGRALAELEGMSKHTFYQRLAAKALQGDFTVPIVRRFSIENIHEALTYAQTDTAGKVMLSLE